MKPIHAVPFVLGPLASMASTSRAEPNTSVAKLNCRKGHIDKSVAKLEGHWGHLGLGTKREVPEWATGGEHVDRHDGQ